MSSRPPVDAPCPSADATLEARFDRLTRQWQEERGPGSLAERLVLHLAYQRIIALGPAVVPLILRQLQREPDHWFWALRVLTEENPVPKSHRGDLAAMAQDWLHWGRRKGLLA